MLPSALVPVACFGQRPRWRAHDHGEATGGIRLRQRGSSIAMRLAEPIACGPASGRTAVEVRPFKTRPFWKMPFCQTPFCQTQAILREAVLPESVQRHAVHVGRCMSRGDDHGQGDSGCGKNRSHGFSPFRLVFTVGDWDLMRQPRPSRPEAIPVVLVQERDGHHKRLRELPAEMP